jgi:hypothetical protein
MRQRTDRADYPVLQADTTNREIQGDCCCLRRQLAEQFAINARLYSEEELLGGDAGSGYVIFDAKKF